MNRSLFTFSLAAVLASSVMIVGCKDKSPAPVKPATADAHDHAGHDDHDDHNHGTKTAPAKTADKHDHNEHDDHDDHATHDDHSEADAHVDQITLTPAAIKRWNITLSKAQKVTLTNHITVPARVSYNLEAIAHVGSLASGKIAALHARLGDEVTKGQVLCEIISPELGQAQSEFILKQAAIETAKASLRVAVTLHENARKLHEESQGIALSEVQKREVDVLSLNGSLQAAQGSRDAARNLLVLLGMDDAAIEALSKTGKVNPAVVIKSPAAGRVIERAASLGESVGPDHDALFVVADMSTLWVIADVPESLASQVEIGAVASIWPIADNATAIDSKVSYIASQLASQTRTLAMRLEIAGKQTTLRPGMFVKVELTTHSNDKPVLAIFESAVQMVENESCVFVPAKDKPNTFVKRPVKLGPQVDRQLPVLLGLEEGEQYVITGSFMLKADLGKAGAAHEH